MTISLSAASRVWAKIGLASFGGPAGQIALMHQELVEKRRWISEERFLNALNFCMLLPGPEAQQLSVYLGWLMHRTKGGLIAGLLFILPGFFCILLLSLVYVSWGNSFIINAVFFGLKAAVLAIVIQAILRIAKKTLKNRLMIAIAVASFFALYFLHIGFPIIILLAGLVGIVCQRWLPAYFENKPENHKSDTALYSIDYLIDQQYLEHTAPSLTRSIKTLLVWLVIWAAPIAAVFMAFGADSVLGKQAVFFSHTAVLSFGGAYAVLAYVAQRVVDDYHWISPREMVDGLALAETTPGPLIMVLQFVAFLAAYRHQTNLSPITAGLLASFLSTWVTFAPCFLWIFLGAPYIEKLRSNIRLQAALKTITAAVVGVIANLSLWFALHTLFGNTQYIQWNFIEFEIPQWASIQWPMFAIMALALIAIIKFNVSTMKTMLMCTVLGLITFGFGWTS
jgi:chromate transporter